MALTKVNYRGAASRRALVGKEIVFKVHGEPQTRTGTLVQCHGNNFQVDMAGTTDWFWVPKIDGMWVPSSQPMECPIPARHGIET